MSDISSNSRSQPDHQPPISIFSPANLSRTRVTRRGTTDHSRSSASDLLDEYLPRPNYHGSLSVPQPGREQPPVSSSAQHISPSPHRRRRRNPESISFDPAEMTETKQDSRFEKMLALLDVDDSLPDSADRRSVVRNTGSIASCSPRRSQDLRSRRHHPRTPSPSLPVVQHMMNPSINPQHTTSFEQLRQIVSTTSPNSKPRRHRQNLHATRSAETESHAEELTGNDSEVFANQPASVHHGGTGSSDQTADTRYPSEDTPRRRRQRVDFPPHSSIMAIPELPTQSSRTKRPWEVSDQARQAARQSVHEKTQIPPERYSTFEQRRHIPGENIRPESLASSISTTESQHSRSDFFDTAPPSDLDLRFPALSPQPSPLNSRRRRGSRQGRGVIDGDAESERDKTDVGVLETQEESAAVPSSNLHVPDIDLRWQSTKRLVDDYINSRRNRSANASPDISNHEETPIHQASQVRLEHQVEDSTTLADMANFSNRAVVDRLDTVTGEVRALRHQVTELQSMLDMMVSGRSGAIETTRKTVTGRNPSGDSQPEEGASFSKLPSPIVDLLVHLDATVRRHIRRERGSNAACNTSPDLETIAQICDASNLDFLRTHITGWEQELRQE